MPRLPSLDLRIHCRSTSGRSHGRGLRLLRWLRCKPQPSGGSPAMTKTESTPGSATLVAVDIAKKHNEVLIEPPGPARRRRFRVANELADYERLAEYLRQLGPRIVVGFEA